MPILVYCSNKSVFIETTVKWHSLFIHIQIRFILHAKKTAFVVEHDFIMATYLADRVIVFDGIPSIKTQANTPTTLLLGMNQFLKGLQITFRRDSENFRPRINKKNSVKVMIEHYITLLLIMWPVANQSADNASHDWTLNHLLHTLLIY